MNAASTFGSDGMDRPAVLLQLRLVHSHGSARDDLLVVPDSGAGMAGALELGGERLSDAQWRAANLCRIAWHGAGKGWQLVNGSETLVCVLNGERASVRRPLAIAPGDSLELGLLRFVVEAEEGARPPVAQAGPVVRPMASTGQTIVALPSDRDAEADFDLRDLALPSGDGRHDGVLDGPFDVLDIAGVQARPAADPLSQLLGEASPPPLATSSAAAHADPLEATSYETDRMSQGRVSAVTQRLSTPESAGTNPAAVLFDELHAEFVRVVGDPTQLAGRIDWEGFLAPVGEPAPTLEELSRKAEPYPLLRDILQPRESIDHIIENFDPLAGRCAESRGGRFAVDGTARRRVG